MYSINRLSCHLTEAILLRRVRLAPVDCTRDDGLTSSTFVDHFTVLSVSSPCLLRLSTMSTTPTSGASAREVEEVEAILERLASATKQPGDSDLRPVLSFLLPSVVTPANGVLPPTAGSSSSAVPTANADAQDTHWFCTKAKSDLHRRAATFLIFLFAFRSPTSKQWTDTLESVVGKCSSCSRGFGAARRNFGRR